MLWWILSASTLCSPRRLMRLGRDGSFPTASVVMVVSLDCLVDPAKEEMVPEVKRSGECRETGQIHLL